MDRVTININQSTVGTVNLGDIVGNIENHLNSVTDDSASEVIIALKEISESVADDASLTAEARRGLLENLDYLSQSVAQDQAQRSQGVIRSVVDTLSKGVGLVGSAASAWSAWGPTVTAFFGL